MTARADRSVGSLPVDGLPEWQLARRQKIVDAALRMLRERDYDQIQISDVVTEAGVARGTVYRYFASKDHLYALVVQQWSGLGDLAPKFPKRYTAEQRVRAWIRRVIRAFEQEPQFFKATVALQDTTDPDATAVMRQVNNGAITALTELFAPLGPTNAADTAKMLWAIMHTLLVGAIFYHGSMKEVGRLSERFIDFVAADLG